MDTSNRDALLALPLEAVRFVLFDLESTGLDAGEDRICEVALVRWQNGVVIDAYETLIDPGRPVAPDAYAINGISSAMLQGAPPFAQAVDALLQFMGDAVLVAHNAAFDVCFLDTELVRIGRPPLRNVVVDTLGLARSFLHHDRYSLGALAERLGIARPSHRAMSDVRALVAVFNDLIERLLALGVETLDDLVRAQRGLLPGETEIPTPPLITDALRHSQRLRIAYRTKGGDPIVRDILPIELYTASGMPRVIAYCFLRNAQRTFYLDRIAEMMLAPGE